MKELQKVVFVVLYFTRLRAKMPSWGRVYTIHQAALVVIPTLEVRKFNFIEVKSFAQGHKVMNSGALIPDTKLSTIMNYCHSKCPMS